MKSRRKFPSHRAQQTQEPPNFQRLLNYTIWLLGRRNYHSAELKEKLKKKNATTNQIKQLLQKLHDLRYLNDASYIASYLAYELTRKPQGLFLLKQKLLRKKIPIEEIETALENFSFDEEEQIKKALSKKKLTSSSFLNTTKQSTRTLSNIGTKRNSIKPLPNSRQISQLHKEKLFRFLQARGFSVDAILKNLK